MNTIFILMTTPHKQCQHWALTGNQVLHTGNAASMSLVTQVKQQLTQLIGANTCCGLNYGQAVNTQPVKQVAKLALVKVSNVSNVSIHNISLSDLVAKSLVKLTCALKVPKNVYFWNGVNNLGGTYAKA